MPEEIKIVFSPLVADTAQGLYGLAALVDLVYRAKEQMCKSYPGISLERNPYTIEKDIELGITVHSCRYFLSEVEEFFKDLFKTGGLPVRSGLWPSVQSGLSKP